MPVGLLRIAAPRPSAAPAPGEGLPTRSDIENWIDAVNELSSSADSYRAAANRIEAATDAHVQQISAPGGTVWEGSGADAARESAYADRGAIYRAADHMRDMAKAANRGAQNLSHARDRALDAIAEAEADDFRVGENLAVSDIRRYSSEQAGLYAARKAKAGEHVSYIVMRAGALVSEDAQVGSELRAGAAALNSMIPQDWEGKPSPAQPIADGNGEIQLYDDSGDGPHTGPEIAKELEQLRDGKRRGIKEVDADGDIFDLWEKYSEGGVRVPIPEEIADKIYDRVVLPDGTTISVRESAGHGPTLDVGYPPGVDGPKKVHLPEAPPPPLIPPPPPPPAGGEAPIIAPPPHLPVMDHPPVQSPPGLSPPWAPSGGAPVLSQPDLPNLDAGILAGVGTVVAGIGGFLAILANPRAALGG
ncbi:hypothetical protein [Mycobacterium sp. SMC-4]|uniref:hypothetical protein n=1 Tax=Mycobacterium sp. SMC-4 TaxID=2857059 RepID=UPI003D04334E